MKVVYTHAVAAGGAALPVNAWPKPSEWLEFKLRYIADMMLLDYREFERMFLGTAYEQADIEIVRTCSAPKTMMRIPTLPPTRGHNEARRESQITCRRCRSHSGRHAPWCNR